MTTDDRNCMDIWREICERAWGDEEFKRRLKTEPDEVMREYGLPAPEGMHFDVVENAPRQMILVLPASPQDRQGVAPPDNRTVDRYHMECV